jgi:hypothetical protein
MCASELQAVRSELNQLKTDVAATEEASVRFRRSLRVESQTARLSPDVQRIVAKIPGASATTECREEACQVHVSAASRADVKAAWSAFLKDPDLRKYANQFAAESGDPIVDTITGKGSFESDLYVVVDTVTDYSTAILALLADFRNTQEFEACMKVSPANGVLECKVVVEPESLTLALAVGGDGVGTPIGVCLTHALTKYLAQQSIPQGVKYGQAYESFDCSNSKGGS